MPLRFRILKRLAYVYYDFQLMYQEIIIERQRRNNGRTYN